MGLRGQPGIVGPKGQKGEAEGESEIVISLDFFLARYKFCFDFLLLVMLCPVCRTTVTLHLFLAILHSVPFTESSSMSVSRLLKLRLAGSSQSDRGRVEVYAYGHWGTVCDDSFDNTDAQVICRLRGYNSGVAKNSAFFGQGSGPIWIDELRCNGDESNLNDCRFNMHHDCNHSEDAGVVCSGQIQT